MMFLIELIGLIVIIFAAMCLICMGISSRMLESYQIEELDDDIIYTVLVTFLIISLVLAGFCVIFHNKPQSFGYQKIESVSENNIE